MQAETIQQTLQNKVLQQPYKTSTNFWRSDKMLQTYIQQHADSNAQAFMVPHFDFTGKICAGEMNAWSLTADKQTPVLVKRNYWGENINKIKFHPDYFKMLDVAVKSHMFTVKWKPEWRQQFAGQLHLLGFGSGFLFAQTESSQYCPLCMTDGAARIIDRFAEDEDKERLLEHVFTQDYTHLFTGAMFLTEKTGGSDVGANIVEAHHQYDNYYTLKGEKWFCSNANAEMILVLARTNPEIKGTRGLSIFLVERILKDGSANPIEIVRLKEKLGVRSMASGECVFENTLAKRIGKEGEGFKIMTEMINLSRLYNSVAAIACARRALNEAYQYVCQRITFGKRTIEHALVQEKLMELTTLYQQNFYLTFRSIAALDAADNGDEHEAALVRLLTPMTKRFTAEKCVYLIRECMELIGGISYVEDGILPKVYRDALVLPIWEGTGNIMVLDMLRAIQKTNCLEKMLDDIKANRALAGTGTSWSHFDKQFEEISQFFASISTIENKANLEIAAKYYLENLSQLYSIALLWKNKNEHTQEWIQPVLEHKQWQMQSAQNHALAPTHISEETVHHAMAWKI
jgi:acyl-CoA dehydrogenase